MKKHKQALLHSKAYEFAHSINGNILGLKYPIVIIPQVSKKFAANLNGLYIGETFEGSTIHEIHFSVWHNLTDELLFDTIAHELCHALQIETGNYSASVKLVDKIDAALRKAVQRRKKGKGR